MRSGTGFVVAFLVMSYASVSWADTDYRCLNACVSSGEKSAICMAQCTYGQPVSPLPGQTPAPKPTHKEFEAPKPVNKIILQQDAPKITPSKNYTCIAECQKSGLQYQLCEERCTVKPEKPIGF
jgi:hypothetical protein